MSGAYTPSINIQYSNGRHRRRQISLQNDKKIPMKREMSNGKRVRVHQRNKMTALIVGIIKFIKSNIVAFYCLSD